MTPNIINIVDDTILDYLNDNNAYLHPAKYLYLSSNWYDLFMTQLALKYGRSTNKIIENGLNLAKARYRGLEVKSSSKVFDGEVLVSAVVEEQLINTETMRYYEEEML